MALKLGSLYVTLDANASGLVRGIEQAMAAVERGAKQIKKASKEIGEAAMAFAAIGGAALKLAEDFDGPTKTAMTQLSNATKQLAIPIAQMLLPAVRSLTEGIRATAQWVAGLDPVLKSHVAMVAKWAIELAGVSMVVSKTMSGVEGLAKVVGMVASVLGSVGIGPLLAIVAGVGLVIGIVLLLHRAWRQNWGDIQDFTAGVVEAITGFFQKGTSWISDAWAELFKMLKKMMNNFLDNIEAVQRALKIKLVNTEGLREGLNGLLDDFKSGQFFTEAYKFGKGIASQIGDGLAEEFPLLLSDLDKMLGGLSGKLKGFFSKKGALSALYDEDARKALSFIPLSQIHTLSNTGFQANEFQSRIFQGPMAQSYTSAGSLDSLVKPVSEAGNGSATSQFLGSILSAAQPIASLSAGVVKALDAEREAAFKALAIRQAEAAALAVNTQRLEAISSGLRAAGTKFLSKMGDMGNFISDTIQAGVQGGPWAAVGAAIAELLSRTKEFARVIALGDSIMAGLARAVEPLMQAFGPPLRGILAAVGFISRQLLGSLKPLFEILGSALEGIGPVLVVVGDLLAALGPLIGIFFGPLKVVFSILPPVLELLARGLAAVAMGILVIVGGLANVWNGIIEGAASMIDGLLKAITGQTFGLGDAIRKAKVDTSGIDEAYSASAEILKGNTDAFAANGVAVNGATAAVNSFADALTNVPTGFKTALARFNAEDVSQGTMLGGMIGASGGGNIIITGDVHVASNDPSQLHKDLQKQARRHSFLKHGTSKNPTAATGGKAD